jgi:hypothetical protein
MDNILRAIINARAANPPNSAQEALPSRITWINAQLIEVRQARALAGLDTSALDFEITRRALDNPSSWGEIGACLFYQGWDSNSPSPH